MRFVGLLACVWMFGAGYHARVFAYPDSCDDVCSTSDCNTSCYINAIEFENGNSISCYTYGTYDYGQECCGDGICATEAGEDSGSCSYDCGHSIATVPTCGSNGCEEGENCNTCPADCGSCGSNSTCNNDGNCDSGEGKDCADCQVMGYCGPGGGSCANPHDYGYSCVDDHCALNDLPFVTTTCVTKFDCDWGWNCVRSPSYDGQFVCVPPWAG